MDEVVDYLIISDLHLRGGFNNPTAGLYHFDEEFAVCQGCLAAIPQKFVEPQAPRCRPRPKFNLGIKHQKTRHQSAIRQTAGDISADGRAVADLTCAEGTGALCEERHCGSERLF